MNMKLSIVKGWRPVACIAALAGVFAAAPSPAAPVYLADYTTDFAAYDFNTAAYATASYQFTGCGPTTGAMILNYFENHFGATGLMEAGGGLATARTLHGPAYMQTGQGGAPDGFGSVYRIEPGMEGYATAKGYDVDVMIHVSPDYTSPSATWDAYGSFGSSWTNDADYFVNTGGSWSIDDQKFYNFVSAKLLAGIPIFLTVDSTGDGSGDHWVPLVGIDVGTYWYYDTYDTTLHSANVKYVGEGGNTSWAISLARTISFLGGEGPGGGGGGGEVPEPGMLVLFAFGLLAFAGFAGYRRRPEA